MMRNIRYPRIRPVDARPVLRGGRQALALRDPLQLTDKTLVVPGDLAPLLNLCDGTREDARDLGASVMIRYGLRLSTDVIEALLMALDDACLLLNDRYEEVKAQALDAYRREPFRPPVLAGKSYPAARGELKQLLDGYLDSSGEREQTHCLSGSGGLISPHIDYVRGGAVYGRIWRRAATLVREAEIAVILGTDHNGSDKALTLTRQHYATPYGELPTAAAEVECLALAIGEERAFAEELNHRAEHSIELAAVWLHHMREGRACPVVPILCGSFSSFIRHNDPISNQDVFTRFIDALKRLMAGRSAVIISAADLSHVGPAFGGPPLDLRGRALLKEADEELIGFICRMEADGFIRSLQKISDRNNVCGAAPIYFSLSLLAGARGQLISYDLCPADERGASVVSICGVFFE